MSDFTIETHHHGSGRSNPSLRWSVLVFFIAALGLPYLAHPNDEAGKLPQLIWRGNSASLDAIHSNRELKRPTRETPGAAQPVDLPQ